MDVLVNISGTQKIDEQAPQEVRFTTVGRLYKEDGDTVLEYDETELTGMGNTKTFIRLSQGISIERRGESAMMLCFKPGEQYLAQYSTPYGDMVLQIYTCEAEYDVAGATANVELAYDFILEDMRGTNRLSVKTQALQN